jgi:outer membrane usher protein
VKPKFTDYYNLAYSKRGKVQLSVTQQLGRTATLYLSSTRPTGAPTMPMSSCRPASTPP